MPKTILRAALFAALLILFIHPPATAADRPAAGEVTRVQGAATVLEAGTPVQLAPGDAVHSGAVLETGPEGRLELSMADGTVLTLGGDSRFELTGYLWMDEADTGLAVLSLSRGAFRAITGAITDTDTPRFEVQTTLATIGIRGTDFWGGYLEADALDVLFVAGGKTVAITNASGETVLTAPGQGTTIQPGQAPTPPTVWSDAKRQRAFATVTFSP